MWRPLYDLYAYSQDGKPSTSVSLHYRVNLSQNTGEDWNDAKLILSTSETKVLNAGIPASEGLTIEPKHEPPPAPPSMAIGKARAVYYRRGRSARCLDVDAELSSEPDDDEDLYGELLGGPMADILPEMSESGAVISKSPMGVNYTVDEFTTVPSDNESHKVLVAIVPLEATISHITTPRKSPLAYLQVCPLSILGYHTIYRFVTCVASAR